MRPTTSRRASSEFQASDCAMRTVRRRVPEGQRDALVAREMRRSVRFRAAADRDTPSEEGQFPVHAQQSEAMTSARPLHRRGGTSHPARSRTVRGSRLARGCSGRGGSFRLVRDRSRFQLARGCSGRGAACALFDIASAYLGVRRPAVPFAGFRHAVYPGVHIAGRVLYCKHFITVEW